MQYFPTFLFALVTFLFASGCSTSGVAEQPAPRTWALAIHGGAGHFGEEDLSAGQQAAYTASLDAAVEIGERILVDGGTSLDAVEAVIRFLEDDSLFNAGRGAVFTSEGVQELDASIADGATRNCGAVTGIRGFKHPISVARSVMDSSEHVFFSGHGAGVFAGALGHDTADGDWFRTEKAYQRYLRAKRRAEETDVLADKRGTVGCVALDKAGNLAAGTSTGGMTYKQHGRIGDSPVIGAGTWADNRSCAVSATGWGEYFIRTGVAQDVHARMIYGDESLGEACRGAIFDEMGALGGDGGIVALDGNGKIALVCNSAGMFRAWATPTDSGVAMFGATQEGTVEVY